MLQNKDIPKLFGSIDFILSLHPVFPSDFRYRQTTTWTVQIILCLSLTYL